MAMNPSFRVETWILIIAICGHFVSTNILREKSYSGFQDSENKVLCVSPLLCLNIKKNADKTGLIEHAIESNVDKYTFNSPSPKSTKWSIVKTILGLRSVIDTLENLLERESTRAIRSNQEAIKKELELIKKERELTKEDSATKNKTVEILLDFEKNNTFLEEKDGGEIKTDGQIWNSPHNDDNNNNSIDAPKANYETTENLKSDPNPKVFQHLLVTEKHSSPEVKSKKSKDIGLELRESKELLKDLLQISLTPLPLITPHKNPGDTGLKEQTIESTEQSRIQDEILKSPQNSVTSTDLAGANFQNGVVMGKPAVVHNVKQRQSHTSPGKLIQIPNSKTSSKALKPRVLNSPLTTENIPNPSTLANATLAPIDKFSHTQNVHETTNGVIFSNVSNSQNLNIENNEIKSNKLGLIKSLVLPNSSEVHLKVQENGANVLTNVVTIPPNAEFNQNPNDSRRIQVEISIDPNKGSQKSSSMKNSRIGRRKQIPLNSLNNHLSLKANQAKRRNAEIEANDNIKDMIKSIYKRLKARYLDRDVPISSVFTTNSGMELLTMENVPTILPPVTHAQAKNLLLNKLIEQLKKFTMDHRNKNDLQQVNNENEGKLEIDNINTISRNQRFREDELIVNPYPLPNTLQRKTAQKAKTISEEENTQIAILEKALSKGLLLKNSDEYAPQSQREKKDLITEGVSPGANIDESVAVSHNKIPPTAFSKLKMAFHYSKFHGKIPPHLISSR